MKDDDRIIVIGTGPAGSAAAVFLARAGANVLLLEAGAEHADRGLTVRVRGMTVAKRRRELHQRDQVIRTLDRDAQVNEDLSPGGLSNHWSCAVPRFSREDFADAARAGEEYTWPISYDDLAPWYSHVEPLLQVAGPTYDVPQVPAGNVCNVRDLAGDWSSLIDAARESARSIVPMSYAYGAGTTATLSGTVFNAFVRLVKPLLAEHKVRIQYGSRAVRLEWSQAKKRVDAVVFRDTRSGSEGRIPCRAVVVAAGALNSAELLLESKSSDFPNGIGNTHGVLGRYLHDHPLAKLVIDVARPLSMHPAAYITRRLAERSVPLHAAAAIQWSGAPIYARSLLSGRPGRLNWIGFSVFGTMVPTRDSFVALGSRRQLAGERNELELHINHSAEAIRSLDETREQVVALLTQVGLSPSVRIWKIEPVGNSNHYGGTCRMHASPAFGMLDSFSRMHGVPNVVVADSAAFTTGPEKNPVVTAMALAARGSDRLAQDLKEGDI